MAEYIASDYHGNHTKLRERTRTQFKTDKEHSEHIFKNHQKTVSKKDIIYFLGDMGDKDFITEYIPKMNGTKVLILGNHDKYSKAFYKEHFDYVYDKPFWLTKRILLSHYPQPVEDGKINIHGHTHDITLRLANYFNVSLDVIDYTPVNIKKFKDYIGTIQKPNYRFMYEWYAEYQTLGIPREDIVVREDGTVDVLASRKLLEKRRGF